MNQPILEKVQGKQRILVAPLDWGLGHATRCIPVIKELLTQNCDVWLAAENAQQHLLATEFPNLPMLELPGYRIKYSKTKQGLAWKMIKQSLKLKRAINAEHKWLKQIIEKYEFDAVISDNRYGLYHVDIPCIFITHQLQIKSPAGKWSEKIFQKKNYNYINRFTECWIPDWAGDNNLAGELSHPTLLPKVSISYVGLLSRLEKKNIDVKQDHLLVILSGPEPQRSILEEKIIEEISHYNGTATIVRGLPGAASLIPSTNMIKFYNHLPSEELAAAMQEAAFIICRSGYSSVMDIATLQKKSVLIPTPGQTEQEYLSASLMEKGFAISFNQEAFSLNTSLAAAKKFQYKLPVIHTNDLLLKKIVLFLKQLAGK